jgi:WD40 repeat protein
VWMGANILVRTRPSETTRVGEVELVHTLEHADGVDYLVPSPTAELLATVHSDRSVSIHDAVTLERQWTRVDAEATSLGWSQSGARLVVAGPDGGAVLDATTGELLLERRDLGLHVERKKNPMPISDSLPGDQLPSR